MAMNRDKRRSESGATDDLDEKVVFVNRCAKTVKGGRRMSFSAVVVVGDHEGKVGVGFGKANEVSDAIRKGGDAARKAMCQITLKGKTAAEKDEEKKQADEAEKAAEAAPGAPGAGFDPSMVVQKPEKTNPVFPIFAIASMLVAIFTIILFMSERSSTGGADLSYTKLVFRYGPNSEHAGEPLGFPVFAGKQWQCPGLPRVTLHR